MKGTAKYGVGVKPEDAEILQAASSGNLKQVEKAISEGADVECIDYLDRVSTPLFHAAVGGYTDIVRCLLRHGASPDTNNGSTTALMIASRFGHYDVVKALIEAGVNVDYADSDGITALQEAKEHIEIVQLLKKASLVKKWWQFWK